MGNKISNGSSPKTGTSAKLIRLNGDLQEFYNPIKISNLRLMTTTSGSFICNSDQMDFDKFLPAMKGEEELQPGQIYFELPVTWLTRRIHAEDMASLVVKASAALVVIKNDVKVRCGCYYPRRKQVDPLVFLNEDQCVRIRPDNRNPRLSKKMTGGGVDKRKTKKFVAELTVILEE